MNLLAKAPRIERRTGRVTLEIRAARREKAVLTIGNPTESEEGDDDRLIDCLYYNQCLKYAVVKEWKGFDCQNCNDYSEDSASMRTSAEDIGISITKAKQEN